uniref:Uncharacterized protein n=1 Tax=Oryza barthii TaxID=65489 RepID=A0A679BAX4_9ORYZ|nr:hypothetical protein [Oryza barthii]
MSAWVLLDLEGVPAHAWNEATAAALIAPCRLISMGDNSERPANYRLLRVSARAPDHALIPRERVLAIPEPAPLAGSAPLLLRYEVSIHVRAVDLTSASAARMGGGPSGPPCGGGPSSGGPGGGGGASGGWSGLAGVSSPALVSHRDRALVVRPALAVRAAAAAALAACTSLSCRRFPLLPPHVCQLQRLSRLGEHATRRLGEHATRWPPHLGRLASRPSRLVGRPPLL